MNSNMITWQKIQVPVRKHVASRIPTMTVCKTCVSFNGAAYNVLFSACLIGQYVDMYRNGNEFMLVKGENMLISKGGATSACIHSKMLIAMMLTTGFTKYTVQPNGKESVILIPVKESK